MTMNHNAFVFDHAAFEVELRPMLLEALETGSIATIAEWIDANRESLVDPYEGDELPEDWEALMEQPNVQTHGDFGLTKFYSPTSSIGLDDAWDTLGELLEQTGSRRAIILGTPLETAQGQQFDPGCSGSYFQTPADVKRSLSEVKAVQERNPALRARLEPIAGMLRSASEAGQGLYVTF